MVEELERYLPAISALCAKYGVVRLDVFGSAARGNFDLETSDFDFLVDFGSVERQGFGDVYFKLLADLEQLLGSKVHFVEDNCQEEPFLNEANRHRQALYAA
jgi:predicted nucleotidyltransferase